MHNALCDVYGMDVPIFAFSHSPGVVAAASKAGGFGVLGASGMDPEELDKALQVISKECQGKAFGIDLLIPEKYIGSYFVGQSVGMFKEIRPAAEVLRMMSEECDAVLKQMGQLVSE